MVHTRFVSQLFSLPLKTEEHEFYPFTEKQMYDVFALLFGAVFLDRDETQSWKIKHLSKKYCDAMMQLVEFNVKEIQRGGILKKITDDIKKDGFLDKYGNYFIRRLLDMKLPVNEIVTIIMTCGAASCANQGQQVFLLLFF